MNKYSVELERQLEIMAKYELSAEEWFFTQLLFLASEPESKPYYLQTYFKDCKKSLVPKDMLSLLKEKKILLNWDYLSLVALACILSWHGQVIAR